MLDRTRGHGATTGFHAFATTVLVAGTTLAAPTPGPAFELDPAVDGLPAWGQQRAPRIASGTAGTVVTWLDFDMDLHGPDRLLLGGVFLATGSNVPVPLPQLPTPLASTGPTDLAWAGSGFVIVHANGLGLVALRLDPKGKLLDIAPRTLAVASSSPETLDVDCDDSGQCVLLWSTSESVQAVGFGWNSPPGTVTTVRTAAGDWTQLGGALAHAGGQVLAAFAERSWTSKQTRLFTRRLSPTALPLADAAELPIAGANKAVPALAPLAAGYLLAWESQQVAYALRLDSAGAPSGMALSLGEGVTPVLSPEPDGVVVFRAVAGGVRALRISAEPQVTDLGLVDAVSGPAAFDGTAHWSVAGEEDVRGTRLEMPIQAGAQPVLLSTAHNSQWDLRTAIAPDGSAALAAWNDNRTGETEVYAQGFTAEGCPRGPSSPVLANANLGAVAADDSGYLVLGWPQEGSFQSASNQWRGLVRRVAADGTPETAEAREVLFPAGQFFALQADVEGGFTATSGDEAIRVDATGQSISSVSLPPSTHSSVAANVAVRVAGGVAVFSLDGSCDMVCVGIALRVSFLNAFGQEIRAPVIVPAYSESTELSVFTTPLGYVVAWHDRGYGFDAWRVGLLTPSGEWSGLSSLPVGAPHSELAHVIAHAGDLVWLVVAGRSYAGDPGAAWLLRTTPSFELVELQDLGLPGPATTGTTGVGTEVLGALVPGLTQPTLLSPWNELPPRSIRIQGRRLDGEECAAERAAPTADAGPDAAMTPYPELAAAGGGCACSAVRQKRDGRAAALLGLALAAWLARRRPAR